jgi:PAS domain S-box-containing protein/hemerythrin-like metal-binding protein
MAIQWDHERMTTGSAAMDAEHQEWILRFNQFDTALVNRLGVDVIYAALQFFAAYSEAHFPDEEALMDQAHCSAAALNRAEHNRFREKLAALNDRFQSDRVSLVDVLELKTELEQWLVRHICEVDAQLRTVLEVTSDSKKTLGEILWPHLEALTEQLDTPVLFSRLAEAIVLASPDTILIVDEQGQLVFVSGHCKDLFGYEAKELLGKNIEILVPAQFAHHAELRLGYQQSPTVRAMGGPTIINARHKSGAQIPVEVSLSPLPPVSGYGQLVQAIVREALPRGAATQDLLVQSVAMNAAANGIVITDLDGMIQWVNPAVTEMTGYSREELIGHHTRIFKSGEHGTAFYQSLWQTVMAGKTWFGEITNRRKDGTIYYEEQHITPVLNDQGEIVRLIAIKQDVTARRQAEMKQQRQLEEIKRLAFLLRYANQELEEKVQERTAELAATNAALAKANQRLRELDDLKSAFIGVISHELRTPFASIQLSLQLIENKYSQDLQPEQLDLLQQLHAHVQEAKTMIDNLVNYADFVRKQGVLQLTAVQLGLILEKVLLVLSHPAEHKGITIRLEVPESLPEVPGDEERLTDAIHELVENAIKFTPADGKITLRAWSEGGDLCFSVQDTGVGIPPEKLPGLWEGFSQMADPVRRGVEGMGLGLALVKYVIEAHQGKVWADSQLGVGSTFGFRLPASGV